MSKADGIVKKYLAQIASKGGKARAEKYDKQTLSEWGKKGGRPRQQASKRKGDK